MTVSGRISILIILLTLIVFIAFVMSVPPIALAQCGGIGSSCVKCHQVTHPVCGTTEWHSTYGHQYACWNCHGGNDQSPAKESAHEGLVRQPLQDAYTSCYSCHPEDYRQLAERFAKTLGVAVSALTPTPRPVVNINNVTYPLVVPTEAVTTVPQDSFDWLWLLGLLPVSGIGLLVWFMWIRRTL